MNLTGKITKILANFYYIIDESNKEWECFARARLLKEGKLLFVGDLVEIETSSQSQGVVVNLLERKNKLDKPSVANIDQVLVVFSAKDPDFDFYNLDRYLSFTSYKLPNEEITICINKIDLKKIDLDKIYNKSNCTIFYVSALTKEGIDELVKNLVNKTTVLTGPSGVGKSTLIKSLVSENLDIKIGSLSAIKQGKHITRNVHLLPFTYKSKSGFLVDTPGFTQIGFAGVNPNKLLLTFKELGNLDCNFSNCLHNGEEGCRIQSSKGLNLIASTRYESYLKILKEALSEIEYRTKIEAKVKTIGGKKKILPKLNEELRNKSRKKIKQDLTSRGMPWHTSTELDN